VEAKKTVCTIPFIYICTGGNDMIYRAIGDPITANEAKAHTHQSAVHRSKGATGCTPKMCDP